jgi:hypothetical protein
MSPLKTSMIMILLSVFGLSVLGCSSVTKALHVRDSVETVLVGRITYEGKGRNLDRWIRGRRRQNIGLVIKEIETGDEYGAAPSGQQGFFLLESPPPGTFAVNLATMEGVDRLGTHLMYFTVEEDTYFVIEEGVVNNLGDLYLSYDDDEGITHLEYQFHQGELEQWFKETYPESSLSRRTWKNVRVGDLQQSAPGSETHI